MEDIEILLDLLHDLNQHNAAHGSQSFDQHVKLVLIALILAHLPLETTNEADIQMLNDVITSPRLQKRMEEFPAGSSETATILKFVRSSMVFYLSIKSEVEKAKKDSFNAIKSGVFQMLKGCYFGAETKSLPGDLEFTISSAIHQAILLFVDGSDDSVKLLVNESKKRLSDELASSWHMDISETAEPDSLGSLLRLWASCLDGNASLCSMEDTQNHVGLFLRSVGVEADLIGIPSVFIGYMEMLSSLASSPVGARVVFKELRDINSPSTTNWKKMFESLNSVVREYRNRSLRDGRRTDIQQQLSNDVLREADTLGLCAFVNVFRQVMLHAPEDEVLSWLPLLDGDWHMTPCWDIFFEVMCCPVPQKLKASLDRTIASLARFAPLVPQIWDRLLRAVVVRRGDFDATNAKNVSVKYDLSYQFNEIETRAEEYEEALAFVHLINELWRNANGALPEGGIRFQHFTKFILVEILGSVFQRPFKSERERWLLICESLLHCRLCIQSLKHVIPLNLFEKEKTPGEYVMRDLLEERNVFRGALFILSQGVDWLRNQVLEDSFAEEKARAVVEALRLVRHALEVDEEFIYSKQATSEAGAYSPLDTVVLHDRSRLQFLMEYSRFEYNSEVRHEALKISQELIRRVPNIVNILESVPAAVNDLRKSIQDGYNLCLEEANNAILAHQQENESSAELGLDIILDSITLPSPNFAQYVCGFDVSGGTDVMFLEDPRYSHSPLLLILELATRSSVASWRPRLYEKALQVIFYLASNIDTGK